MTVSDKIVIVKSLTGDADIGNDVIVAYLSIAEENILRRRFPFGYEGKSLTGEYNLMQCELAARYVLRRGAEGEVSHNENGINRTYDSVNDEDILSRIVPYAKVGG